ncbi:response regulator [Gloeomargaritales cyanobacterium VI4D9]|nr:response regulator [Gloeomargaritales cyanobacterium VI4D9]
MAHFLLVEDRLDICEIWRNWLLEEGHTCQWANTYEDAIQKIWLSEQNDGEPFDMILLDHELDGGFFGINVLEEISEELGQDYKEHRFVVITASHDMGLVSIYSQRGALGYLIKPTSRESFFATIINALERRRIYVENKEDWEAAVRVLEDLELLPKIEQMQRDLEAFQALRETHNKLLKDLKKAGGNEAKIRESYAYAYQAITNNTATIESIIPCLQPFFITESFWEDIEYTFDHERLKFYGLQSYLLRIGNDPNAYRIKHLSGDAPGHYEYRTGITHRLYFRRQDGHIVLERFGHKSKQKEILHFLHETGGGEVYKAHEIVSKIKDTSTY